MAVIRKDDEGLYLVAGGWKARPTEATKFKEGDKPVAKHFGGSPLVGVGKLKGRGKYSEYWRTAGLSDAVLRAEGVE